MTIRKERGLKIKTSPDMEIILIALWLVCVLGFLISYLFIGGWTSLPLFGSIENDQFSDMFNPLYTIMEDNSLHDIYTINNGVSIYPPFAFLVLRAFGQFLPGEHVTHSQYTDMLILLYSATCILILAYLFYKNSRSKKELYKILFILFAFSSAPFIFLLERGNLLLLTLVLSVFFMMYYKSENPALREIAYISLALAAGLKIYPAMLGLMLLREKNWKGAMRCVIYGVIIFVAPFFILGGYGKIVLYIENLKYAAEATKGYHVAAATLLNLSNSIALVVKFLGGTIDTGFAIARYLQYPLLLFALVGLFFVKSDWKTALVLVLVLVMLPSFNWYYSGCFYLIPLFMFLNSEHTRKIDYFYLLFMCTALLPVTFINSIVSNPYRANADFAASGYLCNISGLLLLSVLLPEFLLSVVKKIRSVRLSKNQITGNERG